MNYKSTNEQWEYCSIFHFSGFEPTLNEILNKKGRDGWEAYAVTKNFVGSSIITDVFLKRRKGGAL